jgi:DNA polymerase-3 subunit epsilon
VQSRRPHPALQQPGAPAVQGPGPGADIGGGRGADRPGRSIFSILEKSQIEHAREVIDQRLAAGKLPISTFTTTTRGGQLLRIQMVPVLAASVDSQARALTGYVLTVENITRSIEEEERRDRALHT